MGVESGAIEMGPALSSLSMGSYRGARAHPDCTANTACARKRANGRCGAAGESRATWGCYMRSQGRGVGWLGRNARRSEPRLMCVALARGCKSFWLRRTRPPSLWAGKKGGSRYGTVYILYKVFKGRGCIGRVKKAFSTSKMRERGCSNANAPPAPLWR